MGDRTCEAWILGFRCNIEPPPSVQTEPVVFLVREWKDGVLFHALCPYICAWVIGRMVYCSISYCNISVRGWAHGRVVEGVRVRAKDKIIRNSILLVGSVLRNVIEADEYDMNAYNFSLWSIWRVMELQWNLYGQIVAFLWIQHQGIDREYNFQGNLIASTSHLAPFRMTYNFSCA
jgi:hypothetical protein